MTNQLVLFEDEGYANLLPLVFWRSVFELQISRKIVLDRTAQRLGLAVAGVWTREWLAKVAAQRCGAPANQPVTSGTLLVNGRWLFDQPPEIPKAPCVGVIEDEVVFIACDRALAERLKPEDLLDASRAAAALEGVPRVAVSGKLVRYLWDILADLPELLAADWQPGDATIESELDPGTSVVQRDKVHVGERTIVHPTAVIDASAGPVFLSNDVQIGAFAVLEGPLTIGAGCKVFPHAWLHGGNVIGPVCKIAGEVTSCILNGYTNKSHTGFLGHSYVGSWANFGAGSTNSNLKNTYGQIRVPVNGTEVDSGRQFLGAIVGDHVKIGINATIPTGAVFGLAASVAASRVAPKYVPSFGWVTDDGYRPGDPLRLLDVAAVTMSRRNIEMTDDEVELLLDLGTRVRSYEAPART